MESAFRNSWTYFLLVLTVLALLTGTVWAQGSGEITGLVTDPSGAVISGTTVTLTNSATGEKRTTVTASTGNYRFPSLPVVGTYAIQISPKGFKSLKVEGIVISVGTTVTKDLKLELGSATEQVTVEAGAETVQTSDSSVSQLVDRRIWQQMPLEVRNQNSFIELVAGAVPQDGTGNNRGAEVNGTRGGAGSYLVEGADNNEQGQAGRGQLSPYDKGGASTSISPDAIQEYRVITNTFAAEYGKGGGFVTDTVLKGGTNQWHGSAFAYNRIQALAANDWESNASGTKDRLVRNQFGGSIGGAIIKDRTFFYSSLEFHRARQSAPSGGFTAVTQQFLDFVNSGQLQQWAEGTGAFAPGTATPGICLYYLEGPCPGAFSSIATAGPIFTQLTSGGMPFPAANVTDPCPEQTPNSPCASRGAWSGSALGIAQLYYPVPIYGTLNVSIPQPFNEERFSIKVDHRLTDKDQLSAMYLYQNTNSTNPFSGGNKIIGPPQATLGRGQNFGLTWNHTFSPTLLNSFKVGYLRHRNDFPPSAGTTGVPSYYTIDGLGEDLGLYSGLPQFFTENQFQYLDAISMTKGKHALKFGAEYRRTRNGSSFFNDAYSTIYPWSVEDTVTDLNFTTATENLLYGYPYFGSAYLATAAVVPSTGKEPVFYRGYRANEYAFFGQDDWRVNSRLTVNLGLRWEYFGPPHNYKPGIDSNFYFGSNVTPIPGATNNPGFPATSPFYASVATGSFQIRNNEIWNKDTNNFGPRVGFAWDALGNQKMVVRAGFGIMYDRIYNNLFENIRFNPPYYSDNQIGVFTTGVPVAPGVLALPFTDTQRAFFTAAPKPNPRHMDQNIVTPYYEQAHFGVQWEIAKGYVFEPEYILTMGHKLTGLSDINTFDGRVACVAGPNLQPACVGAGYPGGFSTHRINTNIGSDNFRNNRFSSNYHGLQLSLRKNYSSGLGFTANYTYSKALDALSDAFNNRNGTNPTDIQNVHYDYGPADFDTRHRFVSTVSYELPFMKGNRWLGGWGTNAIISWQTGHPITPYSGSSSYDLNKDGKFSDRLVPTGSPMSTVLGSGSPGIAYFDKTKWSLLDPQGTGIGSCPLTVNQGLWCNAPVGRNTLFGPHFTNVDFNMTKKFKITEKAAVTFQASFFDLFNHPNFLPPDGNIQDSTFGASTATAGDTGGHRVTQLSARFDF